MWSSAYAGVGQLAVLPALQPFDHSLRPFLASTQTGSYTVARAAWIGDYPDPNTFLDMFVTDGENNQTGWSNRQYDQLIEKASSETDPRARFQE